MLNKQFNKFPKRSFLPIHYSFEVECSGSQYDIDVVTKYSFLKVPGKAVILLQMANYWFNGCTRFVQFS